MTPCLKPEINMHFPRRIIFWYLLVRFRGCKQDTLTSKRHEVTAQVPKIALTCFLTHKIYLKFITEIFWWKTFNPTHFLTPQKGRIRCPKDSPFSQGTGWGCEVRSQKGGRIGFVVSHQQKELGWMSCF